MSRKRTQYGQGSVYQRSDGMWVAVGLVPGQSPRRFYGSSPETAVERRADYLARHRLGLPTEATKLTLGRHLAGWLDSKRPPTVRPSTWIGYELQVRHLSTLAGVQLAKLTPNDVRRHLRRLEDEGLSPSSVRANLIVLRMALKQAVNDGLIQRNVASLAAAPRVERHQLAILTQTEIRSFLAAAQQDSDGPFWILLLGSGLRLGEALALRWQDLDLAAGTLTVTGSLRPVDQRIRQPNQERLVRLEPKTDSGWRTIVLPATVLTALTAHRAAMADQKGRSLAGYVFTTPRGTPIDLKNRNRLFCHFLEVNGLRRIRVHDLRHTAASIMLASGATFDDVRRHLGHSQIGVTVDTYGHLVEGRSAEVASGVERALAG